MTDQEKLKILDKLALAKDLIAKDSPSSANIILIDIINELLKPYVSKDKADD